MRRRAKGPAMAFSLAMLLYGLGLLSGAKLTGRPEPQAGIAQLGSTSVVLGNLTPGDSILHSPTRRWVQWTGKRWVDSEGPLMIRGALFKATPQGWIHELCGCEEFCNGRDR